MSDTQNSHICRRILREVKKSGEIYIVLDCDVGHVTTVLREAKEVGMMTAYHNFLITSLDLHLIDMEEFKYGGTNITALRLVDPHRPAVQVGHSMDSLLFQELLPRLQGNSNKKFQSLNGGLLFLEL